MNDQELAAEARRVAPQLRALHTGAVDQLAAELLRQAADRLDVLAAALEAALGFHEEHCGHCHGCCDAYGEPVEWPCNEFRAITAAAQATEESNG